MRTSHASLLFVCTTSALSLSPRPVRGISNVLIVDHLNINHEKGRHDWLCSFYVDLLGCTLDPRKLENLEAGEGTLWANAGIHQFHLPSGKPAPQVWDGTITLAYASLDGVRDRLKDPPAVLAESKFCVLSTGSNGDARIALVDPWGSRFDLVALCDPADPRGTQPGAESSEARALVDLTVNVASGASLPGIGRFYEHVLGMPVLSCEEGERLVLCAGGERADGSPQQTLTFVCTEREHVAHEDLGKDADGNSCNNGAHISLYLHNLRNAYRKADELGIVFVNHRFKRRAYTEEEAIEQCMFRILEVVDPEDVGAGPILQLEHEVRSVTNADGSKYKSCPLLDVDR